MKLLAIVLLATACGAQIGGDTKKSGTPDAPGVEVDVDAPEALVDAADPSVDAPGSPDADPFPAIAMQCAAKGYVTIAGATSLYRSVGNAAEWLQAAADCNDDVPGATHLVVISAATPQPSAELVYLQSNRGWVGLTDRATENAFTNVTGEPNDYRPWATDQPDNGGGDEHCARLTSEGLDDDQCNNDHDYVCECDGRPAL